MGIVRNKTAFFKGLKAADKKARDRFGTIVWNAIELLHHEILRLTPVWSGSAVTNYRWSVGTPEYTFHEPIDNGPPGPTNSMALGPERRRAPNEAASLETLYALSIGNPFQIFWLNNNDPDIIPLDYGLLPPDPLESRAPNGMVRISMGYVEAKLDLGHL